MPNKSVVCLAILASIVMPIAASAQYIGIFMDAEATSCAAQVGPQPWIDLHVIAIQQGDVTEMTGAQFQISGAPEFWTSENILWVPDPGTTITIGNPLFSSPVHPRSAGVNVAFSTCQRGERVPLGRVVILGAQTPEDVRLRVVAFQLFPDEPNCPIIVGCFPPSYGLTCTGGGEIVLNGTGASLGGCQPLALEPNTWSAMKTLFR